MNCCSHLSSELLSLGLSLIAAYVGWNLISWWRKAMGLFDTIGSMFGRSLYKQPDFSHNNIPPLGQWGHLMGKMGNNPNYFTQPLYNPENLGHNPNWNPYAGYRPVWSPATPEKKKQEEKVIEGEVISRGEVKRIESDV